MIVFCIGNSSLLYEVPAQGGTAKIIQLQEPAESILSGPTWTPHFLPSEEGNRSLLVTTGPYADPSIVLVDLLTGEQKRLGSGARPFYAPTGHLIYQPSRDAYELLALPFSLNSSQSTGDPFPIVQNGRDASVAANYTLVYVDGPSGQEQLVWLDRDGNRTGTIGEPAPAIVDPVIAPDGRRLAVGLGESSFYGIWNLDIERGVKTRVTSATENGRLPAWSPTGGQLVFRMSTASGDELVVRQADGSGEPTKPATTPTLGDTNDWSLDGKYLVFQARGPNSGYDLRYLERSGDEDEWRMQPFLQTPEVELGAKLSPDGKHIAYLSRESGRFEVFVQPFPDGGRKIAVSSNGGRQVRWSRDGTELFFVEGNSLMAVTVSRVPSFTVGQPVRLFEHHGLKPELTMPQYDVSIDDRFLLAERVGAEKKRPSIRIVQNWYEEFRDRE